VVSSSGEPLKFFLDGDDVLVERANGQRHFYCPAWHWELALVNLRLRGWEQQ